MAAQAAGMVGAGMKPLPVVYIFCQRVYLPVSQKSYANLLRVRLGQDVVQRR